MNRRPVSRVSYLNLVLDNDLRFVAIRQSGYEENDEINEKIGAATILQSLYVSRTSSNFPFTTI